jgi:hypothetical protein
MTALERGEELKRRAKQRGIVLGDGEPVDMLLCKDDSRRATNARSCRGAAWTTLEACRAEGGRVK